MRNVLVCLLVSLGLGCAQVYGESVAVINFECQDEAKDSDVGAAAADLFELALQQEGMDVYERRYVSWIIREKDLDASSLLDDSQVVRTVLPQVDVLVRGEVLSSGSGRYELELAAVSTRSGLSIMQKRYRGAFPEVLWQGAKALKQCMQDGNDLNAQRRRAVPGFTDSPEAAVLYYQGISQLASGHPGIAVGLFAKAHLADPSFVLALWWKMRTYNSAGLSCVAQEVRKEIAGNMVGNRFLQQFWESAETGYVVRTVALMCDPSQSDAVAATVQHYYDELSRLPSIQLLDVKSLTGLGEEADLALSGYVDVDSYLKSAVWALADDVVTFYQTPTKRLAITVYDTLSGEVRYDQLLPHRNSGKHDALPERVVQAIVTGGKRSETSLRIADDGVDWFSRSRVPACSLSLNKLLYELRNGNEKASTLFELALWYETYQGNYAMALWQALRDEVSPDDPQADLLYSTALWKLRMDKRRGRSVMEDYFQPLIDAYPNSPASLLCLFSMACEIREGGDPETGAEMLLKLSGRIPEELPRRVRSFDIESSYYYQTARALFECGRVEEARDWLNKAERSIRWKPAGRYRTRCRLGLGLGRNGKPKIIYELNEYGGAEFENFLSEYIARLSQRINPVQKVDDRLSMKQLVRRIENTTGENAYRLRAEYLERCLDASGADAEWVTQDRALEYLNWLVARTWRREQREQILWLGESIRDKFRLKGSRDYYKAIGDYVTASELFGGSTDDELLCMMKGHPHHVSVLYKRYMESSRMFRRGGMDVADQCMGVGAWKDALTIYTNLMDSSSSMNTRNDAAIKASRCYALQGDRYAAVEALHEVVRRCKEQGLTAADTQYALAVRDLRNLRLADGYGPSDPSWLYPNQQSVRYSVCSSWDPVFPIVPADTNAVNAALLALLRNTYWTYWNGCPNQNYPQQDVDAFIEAYGSEALPALLAVYPRTRYGQGGNRLPERIIERVATSDDAQKILTAFKQNPELASTAYRLAPRETKEMLVAGLPALRFQSNIFTALLDVVIDHHVTELYPVLFLNIANEGGATHMLIPRVADAMQECNDPKLIGEFRQALSAYLSAGFERREKWTAIGGGAVGVFAAAIQHGVVDGIRGLLDYQYMSMTPREKMKLIEPYLGIPQKGSSVARVALLKDNLDNLIWNSEKKKFAWTKNATLNLTNWETPEDPKDLLIDALRDRDIETVKKLLSEIDDVLAVRDRYGKTAMDCAVLSRSVEAVKLLQQRGVGIRTQNAFGYTALNYAALNGDIAMCRYLLSHGVRVNVLDGTGFAPLHRAVKGKNRPLILLLLDHGADVSLRSRDGHSSLDLASGELREWIATQPRIPQ